MPKTRFEKPFTQQEAIPDSAIAEAVKVLQSGRLHRYNLVPGEEGEANLLEVEYAKYQGSKYCLATTSGGTAMQIALRAVGAKPGDKILQTPSRSPRFPVRLPLLAESQFLSKQLKI